MRLIRHQVDYPACPVAVLCQEPAQVQERRRRIHLASGYFGELMITAFVRGPPPPLEPSQSS